MIFGLLALALADTPVETAIQDIRTAEWKRLAVVDVLSATDLDDPQVLVVQAQALGRLRDPAARKPLERLLSHEDADVRAMAAFGLGLTPGGAAPLRARLAALPVPSEGHHTAQYGERWQVIEGLGRAGTKSDVARLAQKLSEPWPYDDAAARALLRLHRRKIDVSAAKGRLVDALSKAEDPRALRTLGRAVARIGLEGIGSARLDPLEQLAIHAPLSSVRADVARALLTVGDPDRTERVLRWALTDVPLVRASAVEHAPEIAAERVRRALKGHEGDWWLWSAAVARHPEVGRAEGPFRKAWIVSHGGDIPVEEDEPWAVTAARLTSESDVDQLVTYTLDKGVPAPVRTAAAGRLKELEVDRAVLVKLLASPDTGVREAAMAWMEGPPKADLVDEIVLTMRVEKDGEVLRAGIERLKDFRKQRSASVTASRFLKSALKRGATHRAPNVRAASRSLAADLGVEVPDPPESALVRELILPDGTVTTTTGDLPKLLEVEQIVRARIETTAGPIDLVLRPDIAPLAVHNFASLASGGFYDGVWWHRVVPGFVAQSGCPRGDGWGSPGWTIVDEVSDRPFTRGALGMARADRDTGGSQFFLMSEPGRFLDGDYTWFGEVTAGHEVLRELGPDDRVVTLRVFRKIPDDDE